MALHAAAAALATTGGSSASSAITNGTSILLGLAGQLLDMALEHPVLSVFFVAALIPMAIGVLHGLKRL